MKYRDNLNKNTKITRLYMVTKAIMLILIVIAVFFVNYVLSNEFLSAEKYLEQSVLQTASNLKSRITNTFNEMRLLSVKLTDEVDNFSQNNITNFLSTHINDYDYHALVFTYTDGKTIRYEKDNGIISVETIVDDSKMGYELQEKSVFSSHVDNPLLPLAYVNEISVPVYSKDNKLIGVIGSQVIVANYLEILGFNNYDKNGYSYIIDSDGKYIIKPSRDVSGYNSFFDSNKKYLATSEEVVKNSFKTKNNGSFLFREGNKKYVAAYALIDNQDRLVLTVVPLHVLLLHVDKLLGGITVIVILIALLLLALFHYNNSLFTQNQKYIYEIAFTDEVTGCGNKNKFIIDADEVLENSNDDNYALISVDMAQFKALNELYGNEYTKKIIKDVFSIIQKNLTENSICVRDYAGTFVVLYKYENPEFINKYFINKIMDEIQVYNENEMAQVSENSDIIKRAKLLLEFGVYLITDKSVPVEIMCERANIAKQSIKGNIHEHYKYYDDSLIAQILQNKAIEDQMYFALEHNQFHMYLQPKYDIKTRTLTGAEALVRWIHPDKGIIPPYKFIPLFEENGFVIEVDKFIWSQACKFLSKRKQQGKRLFPVSVNVSRLHLNNDAFISELVSLTKKYDVPPEYIELELTESACFNNEKRFKEVITNLKSLGFMLAMDDFGTGYSSLNILRHLHFDVLKLDRGFIVDAVNDERGNVILQTIIDMANKLNMVTLAEGIEMEDQLNYLEKLGCKIAQGYYFGKPSDVETFIKSFLSEEISEKSS